MHLPPYLNYFIIPFLFNKITKDIRQKINKKCGDKINIKIKEYDNGKT
jgi:hypothetical protein